MNRASSLAVALGVLLALGACAGEGGQLPTSEAPAFQTGGVGPSCNLTNLRKATSALFGSRHPANDVAKLFTNKNFNTSAVTPHAYTLFGMIEAKRGQPGWTATNAAQGAELTLRIIACSDLVYTDQALSGTANLSDARAAFEAALDAAGTGAYSVQGGGLNAASIVAKNGEAGLAPPAGGFSTWLGGRTLVIGYEMFSSISTEISGGKVYDWSMIRANGSAALTGLATVSLCADEGIAEELEFRLQHNPTSLGGNILPWSLAHAPGVACLPDVAAHGSLGARMLSALVHVVVPSPLHALVKMGPVSGTIGSFSPVEVVYPQEIVLEFTDQPEDGTVNTPVPLTVRVTGAEGTPWEDIDVTLTAFANNGASLEVCGEVEKTNAAGEAVFDNLRFSKPGGAYVVATTTEPGVDIDVTAYSQASASSNRFNIRPGSGGVPCS
jgi:hypothetical protein